MSLSWIDHIRQLDKSTISELISVVATLRGVLGTTGDEDSSIIRLNWAKSDWNVEIDIENFSLFSLMVDVVKCYNFLVKFEKVDFVCSDDFNFLLILICLGAIYHSDPCLCKVICHCQLRISVERNVLSLSTRIYLVISILQLSSIVISLRINSSCVSSSSVVRPRSPISDHS